MLCHPPGQGKLRGQPHGGRPRATVALLRPVRYTARVMTTEQQLLAAIEALDEAAARLRQGGEDVDLAGCLARIDFLAATLPPETDPQLRHFVQQQSYQKARRLLERSVARTNPGA